MTTEKNIYSIEEDNGKSPYPKFMMRYFQKLQSNFSLTIFSGSVVTRFLALTAAALLTFDLPTTAAGYSLQPEQPSPVISNSFPQAQSTAAAPEEKDFGQQIHFIRIHKLSHTLELFEKGKAAPICTYPCAVAKNPGDKRRAGDNTTPTSWGDVVYSIPEALPGAPSEKIPFVVDEILYAADWTHDFGDGQGEIAGAYGPWFISLNTGWDEIGIHGTHDPDSIGTNASEGCIRLRNEDVAQLKDLLSEYADGIGVRVVITED